MMALRQSPTRMALVGAGIVLAAIAVVFSVASAQAEGPPPPPPWVNADGTVDHSRMPDQIPVLNSRGEVVDHIRTEQLAPLPDLTPAQARQRASAGAGEWDPPSQVQPDGSEARELRSAR